MLNTIFLSTPSARRATRHADDCCLVDAISIHALREEGDRSCSVQTLTACISIHALREEGDVQYSGTRRPSLNFYPRPPRGGRPVLPEQPVRHEKISIHALREEGDVAAHCGIIG